MEYREGLQGGLWRPFLLRFLISACWRRIVAAIAGSICSYLQYMLKAVRGLSMSLTHGVSESSSSCIGSDPFPTPLGHGGLMPFPAGRAGLQPCTLRCTNVATLQGRHAWHVHPTMAPKRRQNEVHKMRTMWTRESPSPTADMLGQPTKSLGLNSFCTQSGITISSRDIYFCMRHKLSLQAQTIIF